MIKDVRNFVLLVWRGIWWTLPCHKICLSVNFVLMWEDLALEFFHWILGLAVLHNLHSNASRTFDVHGKRENIWYHFTALSFQEFDSENYIDANWKTLSLVKTMFLVLFQLFSNLRTFGNLSWWYILSSSQLFVHQLTSHWVYTLRSRCVYLFTCVRVKSNIFKVFLTNLGFSVNTILRITFTLIKTYGNIPRVVYLSRSNGSAIKATT